MKCTKKEKDRLVKGAIVGGVVGACVGMPFLGAAVGSGLNYLDKDKKKPKKM